MRQDKRKGITGLVVLALIVVAAIVYTYLTIDQSNKQPVEKSGEVHPHVDSTKLSVVSGPLSVVEGGAPHHGQLTTDK